MYHLQPLLPPVINYYSLVHQGLLWVNEVSSRQLQLWQALNCTLIAKKTTNIHNCKSDSGDVNNHKFVYITSNAHVWHTLMTYLFCLPPTRLIHRCSEPYLPLLPICRASLPLASTNLYCFVTEPHVQRTRPALPYEMC